MNPPLPVAKSVTLQVMIPASRHGGKYKNLNNDKI